MIRCSLKCHLFTPPHTDEQLEGLVVLRSPDKACEWVHTLLHLSSDLHMVLCFTQTSTVAKTVMKMMKITMTTATTTPMMTAVSTLPEPGVSGGGREIGEGDTP